MIDLHTYSMINVRQWDTYFNRNEHEKISGTLRNQKLLKYLKIMQNSHSHFHCNI